ncbi:TonB-dependent receptor [Litorilituus lipolyticus]|uniref:TonB-dependent receptor n=2 Tax=Litorilituus lipolyticus TaxID=2491017 RepID=A0A502L826_9GAMM|nr:TonB-dependent receptor [Litorilituus lipolyticus]
MLSAPSAMAADTFNGSVKGVITDTSDVATSGATITLKHKGKNITRTVTTNADGSYTLRKLPVGEYTMTITKEGFDTIQKSDLEVTVGGAIIYNGVLLAEGNTDADIERISVTGSRISRVDLESSTGGIVVTAGDLAKMPVESGFEAMALLAPGTTGNTAFGGASIGGSSSAENGYYLNGINITTIKTGIGSIDLPWEAISQTEIKTGGIDPEFGGALGGIVNAISKSGSNEFEFGAYGRIDPEATRSHHDNLLNSDGSVYSNSAQDESTFTRASIWASGAIVEDSLFFYALYAPQENDYRAAHSTTLDDGSTTSDRYFGKLDWYINDEHSIEFTTIGFTKKGKGTSYKNNWETQEVGESTGTYASRSGGDVYGLKYTGLLTDDLSVEVIAGRTVDKTYNAVENSDPLVWSQMTGSWKIISSHTDSTVRESEFIRDQFRFDFNWTLDNHDIKFGLDYTHIDVDYQARPNGVPGREGWWDVGYAWDGHVSGIPAGTPYVKQRIRTDFSDSEVTSTALYIQDTWNVTDQLVLNLGLRYADVSNTVPDGRKYVDVKGQIAPRLQAIYDVFGDGATKVYATYGRYYQPVSANMNIVQGGARRDVHDYYLIGDTDANGEVILLPDGSPSTGDHVSTYIAQDGTTEPALKATSNLESMYNDEITLGFEQELMDGDMVLGMRAIYRDLGRSIEDTDYEGVATKYFEANGITPADGATPGYVLANPGEDFEMKYDFDGDGTIDTMFIPASELGLPPAERQYGALETTLSGIAGDSFTYNASYTWSHGWGNTEGLVKTDNGQADPGWTTSYDYADLMDHGNGDLPNDKRHAFKLNGFYNITEDLTFGFNAIIASGSPINKLGMHPEGVDSCEAGSVWEDCYSRYYGHTSFYDENGNPAPRGSAGTTDWTQELDLSLAYNIELGGGDLMLKATVYNVFDSDTQTGVNQTRTRDGANGIELNPDWGRTTSRLGARYVSFEARYAF